MTDRKQLATDFDDEEIIEEIKAPTQAVKDETGTPYCLEHHCRMKQTTGGKKGSPVAYFACPVDGCDEKAKRVKTSKSIPSEPHYCPRCTVGNEPSILRRNINLSTGFYSILSCGNCNYNSGPMPRPEYVASHEPRLLAQSVQEIGAR